MTTPTRRELGGGLAALALALVSGSPRAAEGAPSASPSAAHDMGMPTGWMGREKIAMLLYPGFTALDLVGPHHMLTSLMGAETRLVARTREPVRSESGLVLVPDASFAEVAADLDIFFVPGGSNGTLAAMKDEETVAFVADRGGRARFVTSVCTGSLILGAAGLLKGYEATSHWTTRSLLPVFGAVPVDRRVVRDRNRITGAGVTAGLDFGLTLVGELRDRLYAETVQLLAEYAPEPPYAAGSPHTAPEPAKQLVEAMLGDFLVRLEAAGREAAARHGVR
ncbi:MAG: DJ-1/PfpI family protein [Siculibacillus sp.]|nr:DJ-1/PfpI family protein [Siculibacillus sp.]